MLEGRVGIKIGLPVFAVLLAVGGLARGQESVPQRGEMPLATQALAGDGSLPYMVRRHLQQVTVPPADVFVATDGCDTCGWSGGLAAHNATGTDGPFATIPRAQIAVQGLRSSRTSGLIRVMVRGGTYYLQQ